jgi:hypothetical protein
MVISQWIAPLRAMEINTIEDDDQSELTPASCSWDRASES